MARGRPVVVMVNSNSDARTILDDSGCGVYLPPGQPALLAETIRKLKASPEEREEMGNRGRKYSENNFSIKRCADSYEELFEEVLEKS